MHKNKTSRHSWIWVSVLILFVCVAASVFLLADRLNGFLLDDSGAISLISENNSANSDETKPEDDSQNANSNEQSSDTQPTVDVNTPPVVSQPQTNPGFEVADDRTVWDTNTQIEIFRVSYVNGEQIITVNSDDGDKLIAPGTKNSYTFKLRNTGDVALDYTVTVDAYFTPQDITIPITGRINRYDGKWIAGDWETYATVSQLDAATDSATVGAGRYTYYTLDWLWPYESGNDELDTMLGNLATEQDLVFTIVISTTATESSDPDNDSGITTPKTGEEINFPLWIVFLVSFLILVISGVQMWRKK